jgi:acyl-CoA reductase-like NAD-dependent aldehyde dehydrogenase
MSRPAFALQNTHLDWKQDIRKREHHIHDFAQELRKNKEELARKITQEMGKAIREGLKLLTRLFSRIYFMGTHEQES